MKKNPAGWICLLHWYQCDILKHQTLGKFHLRKTNLSIWSLSFLWHSTNQSMAASSQNSHLAALDIAVKPGSCSYKNPLGTPVFFLISPLVLAEKTGNANPKDSKTGWELKRNLFHFSPRTWQRIFECLELALFLTAKQEHCSSLSQAFDKSCTAAVFIAVNTGF